MRLAEPEDLDLDQAEFEKALASNVEWLKWRGPVIKSNDVAQTRAAMRALGIGKVTVTPTADGWTFKGDGNLSGMVGALGALRGSPRRPPPVSRAGRFTDRLRRPKPALEMRHELIVVMHPVRLPCKAAGSQDVPGR